MSWHAFAAAASELESNEVLCAQCERAFASHRAWRLDALYKHGERVPEENLVTGTACPACRKDCRSRLCVLHHLRWGASACVEAAASGMFPLASLAEVAATTTAARHVGTHERCGPPVMG